MKKYGEVADISNVRKALSNIKELVDQKAFTKDVEKEIFDVKCELDNAIQQRTKTVDIPGYLSKYDDAIISNNRRFAELDRRLKDANEICQNMSKLVSRAVSTTTYKTDMKRISENFKKSIMFDDLQKHLDYINPTVNSCLIKINEYDKEIAKGKQECNVCI